MYTKAEIVRQEGSGDFVAGRGCLACFGVDEEEEEGSRLREKVD